MADRILRCLPRSASGDEYIQISAIRLFGPQQMMFRTMDILVPPHLASTVQVFDRWRKRVSGVEIANGIGVRLCRMPVHCTFNFRGFSLDLHECFTCSAIWGLGLYMLSADQFTSRPNRAAARGVRHL